MNSSTKNTPDAIHSEFMFLLAQINRQWRRIIDRLLRPLGLTEALWLPLLHVARGPELMRQKDLAASLSLDASSLVRVIDGLETAGFIKRTEDPRDRRAKNICLTQVGHETVLAVRELVHKKREHILSVLDDEELRHTWKVLGQISSSLSAVEEEDA